MDITYKRLQKLISSFKRATKLICKQGTEQWSRVHPMIGHRAELFEILASTSLKYIIVYNYTSTSKQKFLFVSEAKEGYLSTPPMLYSCMNISQLRHTKSLTKVQSYKVPGLHTTPPINSLIVVSLHDFGTGNVLP